MLSKIIAALKAKNWRREETHIDYVLIGPKFAYKIKKPVKFSFVDYSTLARRKHFCQEEVRLNRRYSPSLYLGVVPVKQNGKVIEYAVKMRALPQSKRVDHLLASNRLTPAMIDKIANLIAAFHLKAKPARPDNLKKTIIQNFRLIKFARRKALARYLSSFVKKRSPFHNVRDLHGDLHTENIYYVGQPYFLDCIEFNRSFRCIDTAAEIGHLLMDLEFRRRPALARRFLHKYLTLTRDFGLLPLLNFYKCHYACVRGLVNGLERRAVLARKYYQLAAKYAKAKPLIIAVGGLIGTGKSTLAKALSKKLGFKLLRSDEVRKRLANLRPLSHPRTTFRRGMYSSSFGDRTYLKMFALGQAALKRGRNVIFDASFALKKYRTWLKRLAKRNQVNFLFIETTAPDSVIIKRLKQRRRDVSDAGPKLLAKFKKYYQPPNELPALRLPG